MNPLDDSILNALLTNNGNAVFINESDTVEFKSIWNWSNKEHRAKYSKSFAAFCNNKGGYLIFGIEDKTKEIKGIVGFDEVDLASMADYLNNYFSPSISFQKRKVSLGGKEIGVIYIEKCHAIPSICIKEYNTILWDGAIFYRYPGKSDIIKGPDLINLLHRLKGGSQTELVDLKRLEMKQKARPFLYLMGAGRQQNTFNIKIGNNGERAKIMSVSAKTANITLLGTDFPSWIEKGNSKTLHGTTIDLSPANFASFEIEILFEDAIETKYSIIYSKQANENKLSEPVEI